MTAKYRSRRARVAALSQDLRRQGQTWAQIAARIAADEHVTMRVAFRLAHGLSQREVAALWCEEFPTEAGTASMSDKTISYWESWPQSGYEPSLKSLKRLARIYQCNVGDLIDNGDFSYLDTATRRIKTRPAMASLTISERTEFASDTGQISLGRAVGEVEVRGTQDSKPGTALSPAIMELCAVITDCGFNPDRFCSISREEVPSSRDLERDLRIAFDTYQRSKFTAAAGRVTMLLADSHLAVRECDQADRATVSRVLALSYQVAASVLTKVGQSDIAWIAAERGFNAAEGSVDPPVRASLLRSVAFALHSTGRFEPAMDLVESGAGYLQNENAGDDAALSVYGTLLLVGSMAAARFGDGRRAASYLQEADIAAQRLGRDSNHLWTAFGPTNVAIHRVNTAMELGDVQTALDSGLSLNTDGVPVERQVRYLLDIARAYSLTGNRDEALRTTLTAERIAPEQVRQHYLSKKIVMALMQGTPRKPTIELERLAERVKVRELI
jgi:transcriptional regulator with XRE-family HTH domain/tetratricopeptide (TPR) repeat protein